MKTAWTGMAMWLSFAGFFGTAAARPLVAADRFVTLQQGEVEAGLDLAIGLSSGQTGGRLAVDTGYRHDRRGGLSVAVGVLDEVEVGAAIRAVHWDRDFGSDFGGVELYGTFGFLPFLGVEAGVLVSGFSRGEEGDMLHPALRLGVPFRFTLIESVFAVFSRTDFVFGFRRDRTGAEWFTDLGCTTNATPWLFFEAYLGMTRALSGGGAVSSWFGGFVLDRKRLAIPLGAGVGFTLWRRLDLFVSFNLEDIRNRKLDDRNVTLSSSIRW